MTIPLSEVATLSNAVVDEIEKAIVGKRARLMEIMAALLTPGGHVLLEDYPGLAKTLIAKSFATTLGMDFRRIQFTPDLLPGDITGGTIFDRERNAFSLYRGPLFAHLILADEINRASPRTQSALLEAMQEYQVTIEGETVALPVPFIVIATQNPIEYEGTFPLPEAQLDRFIMKLALGYPSAEEEQKILQRRRERKNDNFDLQPVTNAQVLIDMRQAVEEVYVDTDIERYIVELIAATRRNRQIAVGASPRATLALLKLSRSWAAIHGRAYVIPDDIKRFCIPVLSHRLILEPDLWTVKRASEDIIENILRIVPVPVLRRSVHQS